MLRRSMLRLGRPWVGVLWLALCAGPVAAQFQKTPWPAAQATPVLDLTDLQGQRWTPERLKGRAVVLNFWATWCPPCKEELPSLQTLHELGGGDPLVLGINVRETASRVRRYLDSTGIAFPVVLDPQAELARRLGVTAFPTTLLIAPDGQIRWRVVGEVDWAGPEAGRWIASLSGPHR
ncbi:MAG: TlpA family protein disulfide reductase [Limnohabitans sp.]